MRVLELAKRGQTRWRPLASPSLVIRMDDGDITTPLNIVKHMLSANNCLQLMSMVNNKYNGHIGLIYNASIRCATPPVN